MKQKKGFSLIEIPAAVVILVVIGAIVGIGTSVNSSMMGTNPSTHLNASLSNASLGLLEVTSQSNLLGLIIIMGAVITVLLASFGGVFMGGGRGGL